jgi:nucleoside-diphosphate-sugar epimerase
LIKIGILGEGWLGSYLLQRLQENGFEVTGSKTFGCYFRNTRWEGELSAFLEGLSHLIITIPSGASRNSSDHKEGNLPLFKQLIGHLNRNANLTVFYTSSISVYGKSERVIDENIELDPKTSSAKVITRIEQEFENSAIQRFNALRLGGLIGEDRHPIYSLLSTKKSIASDERINFIDREDIVQCIQWLFDHPQEGPLNLVAPFHPTKKEYYTRIAEERNLGLPIFTEGGIASEVVSIKLPLEQLCTKGI